MFATMLVIGATVVTTVRRAGSLSAGAASESLAHPAPRTARVATPERRARVLRAGTAVLLRAVPSITVESSQRDPSPDDNFR
jgi:hypothetical protein